MRLSRSCHDVHLLWIRSTDSLISPCPFFRLLGRLVRLSVCPLTYRQAGVERPRFESTRFYPARAAAESLSLSPRAPLPLCLGGWRSSVHPRDTLTPAASFGSLCITTDVTNYMLVSRRPLTQPLNCSLPVCQSLRAPPLLPFAPVMQSNSAPGIILARLGAPCSPVCVCVCVYVCACICV